MKNKYRDVPDSKGRQKIKGFESIKEKFLLGLLTQFIVHKMLLPPKAYFISSEIRDQIEYHIKLYNNMILDTMELK